MNRTEHDPSSWTDQLAVAAVFGLIALAALAGFVLFSEPPSRQPLPPFAAGYSEAPLEKALDAHTPDALLARIREAGGKPGERTVGRFTGAPGFYRTEQLILDTFREAGLEVQTQEFRVAVPVTDFCEILDESGKPLPGISLYPFYPSGLSPVALPPEGLTGDLLIAENSELLHLAGRDPSNTLVATYIDAAAGWPSLAAVGVRALLVMEDDLARRLRSNPDAVSPWESLFTPCETDFPRLLVRGDLSPHQGRRLTLRCRVRWEEKKVRNLVGVLRGAASARREALVLNAYYDSSSLTPDYAPGAEQAVPLAMFLQSVHALAPYKGSLSRDVVFTATAAHAQAMAGVSRLMEAVEPFLKNRGDWVSPEETIAGHSNTLAMAERALAALKAPESAPGPRDAAFRQWLDKRAAAAAGEVNLDFRDRALDRRLAYLRAGNPVFRPGFEPLLATDEERKNPANRHPLFQALYEAQQLENRAGALMGLPFNQLAEKPEFAEWGVRDRLGAQLLAIAAHARQSIRETDDTRALRRLFEPYSGTLVLNLELNSGGSRQLANLSLLTGVLSIGTEVEPQVSLLANALSDRVPVGTNGTPVLAVFHWGARDAAGSREKQNPHVSWNAVYESEPWAMCGRLAFSLFNAEFKSPRIGTPEDGFEDLRTDVLRLQAPVLARTFLALSHGQVPFKSLPGDNRSRIMDLHGAVYGVAGTQTLTPSHPMADSTFVTVYNEPRLPLNQNAGVAAAPVLKVNPFGRYEQKLVFGLITDFGWTTSYKADAARFDEDGRLRYFKNASQAGQSIFKNEAVSSSDIVASSGKIPKSVQIALFRCARVQQFDWSNPQTMKSFQRMNYMAKQGLTGPGNNRFDNYSAYLDPDFIFYLGLMAGSADNPEVQVYRAFMLNADLDEPIAPDEPELHGRGYLAADTPTLTFPHIDAAASMLRTNEKRLRLQRRHGLADSLMLDFHARGLEWLATAKRKLQEKDPLGAVLAADTSLAYAINNHPVIRSRISHAIIGILWYLGLLVPFVFFFEKLVFGFTDVRKQLLAGGAIFLVIFGLLRFFHPAFQMVRSSLMILIGFVILLLTLLVILMVGGKFGQNIRDLRRREGAIEGADINRGGVIGTAFMLGLNNMRRRKVRTGLTSVTLILITFVMICFTSVSSDLENVEYVTGRSPWNGILLQNTDYTPLTQAEINTIQQLYGRRFPITTRAWFVAQPGAARLQNAEILVDREYTVNGQLVRKRASLAAAVRMDWREPSFSGIDRHLITNPDWFPKPPQTRAERQDAFASGYVNKRRVILPDVAARELDLTPETVNQGGVEVSIRGDLYEVTGIIDSARLQAHLDIDGRSLLPYDLNSVQTLGRSASGGLIVPESALRLPGSQVMIVNTSPRRADNDGEILMSCGILFPREPHVIEPGQPPLQPLSFKEQRREVMDYLERLGQSASYAIDGTAYFGSRTRARTFAGLLELLIPILIASLTVFNTMRSSVYERKDEIYVYNAVGIAPSHVFFMFMAEASVFAVVGAMLGYLLSQATGRVLTALHFTGGLNMSYSSIETIYASLAIVCAVMLSTLIPARNAAKLASPSGKTEWDIPPAEGDVRSFNLPFTFTPHDRVAVISYFTRWLDSNGEGGSGPFFCAPPESTLERAPGGAIVPGVTTTVWLKPFDLGVSQRLEITLPLDPRTHEFIATIRLVRLSGSAAAWTRSVAPFLAVLRKQFLTWRAARPEERAEMYEEGVALLKDRPIKEARS